VAYQMWLQAALHRPLSARRPDAQWRGSASNCLHPHLPTPVHGLHALPRWRSPQRSARQFAVDLSAFEFSRPISHRLIHINLKSPTQSDLCYFYAFDPKFDFFRVTNYRAFSGNPEDCRVTIEILGNEELDDVSIMERVDSQISALGFWKAQSIAWHAVEHLGSGLPAPTIKNMKAIRKLNTHLQENLRAHIKICGIGSDNGVFSKK